LNALKDIDPDSFVHVGMDEIRNNYLVNPKHDIQKLVDAERLAFKVETTTKEHTIYLYRCLEAGYYDLTLLNHKGRDLDNITQRMMQNLKKVSLPDDAPRTQYFDAFLNNMELIRLAFNVDHFSGRVHTPITSLKGEYRKNILLGGKETISIDVVTMQPLLLGSILKTKIGENEYSNWIDAGEDIYIKLQNKAKFSTRNEAKKRFFEILFSRPNDELLKLFGNSSWIEWINDFKRQPFEPNPHTIEKNHSNLAWLLQNKEVNIMRKVWSKLLEHGILFISVHDEVIVPLEQYNEATTIFQSVMDKHFDYYRLSDKQSPTEKQPENSQKTVLEQSPPDEVKPTTNGKQPNNAKLKTKNPIKGKLYSTKELKEQYQLTDETINKEFEEFYHNILWKPEHKFQSIRS
jgi:hypothetical protein